MKGVFVALGGVAAAVVGAVLIAASLPASPAAAYELTATMDEAQALSTCADGVGDPPNNGGGTAAIKYDANTNVLTWNISYANLSGAPNAAHFHGPANPGMDAGIQVTIDHTMNPVTGMATLTAAQETQLLAGMWYVNYHTAACPGGEVRGQVTVASVGGVAELPGTDGAALQSDASSGGQSAGFIGGIAAVTSGVALLASGAWFMRHRFARSRA